MRGWRMGAVAVLCVGAVGVVLNAPAGAFGSVGYLRIPVTLGNASDLVVSGDGNVVSPDRVLVRNVASGATSSMAANEYVLAFDDDGSHAVIATASGYRFRSFGGGADRPIAVGPLNPNEGFRAGGVLSANGSTFVFESLIYGTSDLLGAVWASVGTAPPVDLTVGLPRRGGSRYWAVRPTVSDDGRYVVFLWQNYDVSCPTRADCPTDVVLRDLVTQQTEIVSVNAQGLASEGSERLPVLSGDGRYVAWVSDGLDMEPGLTVRRARVYLRDRVTGITRRVADEAEIQELGISRDGERVGLTTLVSVDGYPSRTDVHVVDLTDGTSVRLGPASPVDPDGYTTLVRVSSNGADVLVSTSASNLAPGIGPGSLVRARLPLPAPVPATRTFPSFPPDPVVPHGTAPTLVAVPGLGNQRTLFAVSNDGRYTLADDYQHRGPGSELRRYDLWGTPSALLTHWQTPPTMSGDGRYQIRGACRVAIDTGTVVRAPGGSCEEYGVTSRDGSVVWFTPGSLWPIGGEVRAFPVVPPGTGQLFRASLSEDGRLLTVARTLASPCVLTDQCLEIVEYDTTTAASHVIVPAQRRITAWDVSANGRFIVFGTTDGAPRIGAFQMLAIHRIDTTTGADILVANPASGQPTVSNEGRVAYVAPGDITLDGGLTTGDRVHVWTEQQGARTIDWAPNGAPPNRRGDGVILIAGPRISADGHVVVFNTDATNLPATYAAFLDGSPSPPYLTTVVPTRVLDTRAGTQIGYQGDKPAAGATVRLVLDPTVVPGDATAVVLNVTGTEATNDGYVTVWPCDAPRPTASNLNLTRGATTPNLVIAKPAADHTVCLYTQTGTHLIADLAGYYPANSPLTTVVPTRVLDTRAGTQIGYQGDKPAAGATVRLVLDPTVVPGDATAVVLNVTGTEATNDGYVTVWPCDAPRPTASNLNLTRGATTPNLVIAKPAADHTVCLYTQTGTHLIADLAGYYPANSPLTTVVPTRVLDTRAGTQIGYQGDKPAAGATVRLVLDPTVVPGDATAVVLNVTGTEATNDGYVTVWPCDAPRPTASNLNLTRGATTPNLVIAKPAADHTVCLYTQTGTHLIADLAGYER